MTAIPTEINVSPGPPVLHEKNAMTPLTKHTAAKTVAASPRLLHLRNALLCFESLLISCPQHGQHNILGPFHIPIPQRTYRACPPNNHKITHVQLLPIGLASMLFLFSSVSQTMLDFQHFLWPPQCTTIYSLNQRCRVLICAASPSLSQHENFVFVFDWPSASRDSIAPYDLSAEWADDCCVAGPYLFSALFAVPLPTLLLPNPVAIL